MYFRSTRFGPEHQLIGLSALLVFGCLAYILYQPRQHVIDALVPLGISIGVGAYILRLKRQSVPRSESRRMLKYAGIGVVFAGGISFAELLLHVSNGLPVSSFPDQVLSFSSIGLVTGVLAGRTVATTSQEDHQGDRSRVVVETSWLNRPGSTAVLPALGEALAEAQGVDPIDLEPLYTHVDPEVFDTLQSHDGSPWQLTLYTDEYEIRVSSHGTVTVYQLESADRVPSVDFTLS